MAGSPKRATSSSSSLQNTMHFLRPSSSSSFQGNYPRSEDAFIERPVDGFYAVFDGHGGSEAADFLQENLWGYFSHVLKRVNVDTKRLACHAIQCLDHDLMHSMVSQHHSIYCGSCALFSYVDRVNKRLHLYNIGDCRAVMGKVTKSACGNGSVYVAKQLTTDHNCANETEVERVKTSSGDPHAVTFSPNDPYAGTPNATLRVAGYLAVTRSFGDPYLKISEVAKVAKICHSKYITCEPEIVSLQIENEDDFVVLASDGLWEVLSNEEAVQVIAKKLKMIKKRNRKSSRSESSDSPTFSSYSDKNGGQSDSELENSDGHNHNHNHNQEHHSTPQRHHSHHNRDKYDNDEDEDYTETENGSSEPHHTASVYEQIFSPSRWLNFSFLSLTPKAFLISPKIHEPSEDDQLDVDSQMEHESVDSILDCDDAEQEQIFEQDDLAQILVDYALLRVSRKYQMPLKAFKNLPPKVKRSFHDDITAVVFFLK